MIQPAAPSAETAIEEARETWQRGYRDAMAAGREIPVVDVPASLGDAARVSVEATQSLTRLGNRRSFTVSIDIGDMERQRRSRQELQQQQERDAQYQRVTAQRKRQRRRSRRR